MFCERMELNAEDLDAKLTEFKDSKVSGVFELDTSRLKSMTQVKQVLEMEGGVNILDQGSGAIYLATQFPNEKKPIQAVAHIQINKNVKQCALTVYSGNTTFHDVVARNLLDMISSPK